MAGCTVKLIQLMTSELTVTVTCVKVFSTGDFFCLPPGFALQENIIRAARCEVKQSGGWVAGVMGDEAGKGQLEEDKTEF